MDWSKTQKNIGARPDGDPGRETWGKLILKVGTPDASTLERVAQGCAKYCSAYGIDTPARIADFLAQMAHETQGFTRFEENLNYSAQGLADTWPSRYAVNPSAKLRTPNAKAIALARRPEAIANDTYALRMGNLDQAHDNDNHPDGWQYRGRGPMMLTGKDQYEDASAVTGLDLVGMPDLAADPFTGILIACAYWKKRNINAAVDRGDFSASRKLVNGGLIGLADVDSRRTPLLKVLAA